MEAIKRLRDTDTQIALKKIGYDARNPYTQSGQISGRDYSAAIGRLPSETGGEVLDMDPASPTYGELLFIVDISAVDGPDVIK